MKKIILIAMVFTLFSSYAFTQGTGNYIIIINDDSIQINLDVNKQYTTTSGEELTIKLVQPEVLTYSDDMISFQYDNTLSVSNSEIESGIEQCVVMKSTGNGFFIQKYKTIDPSSLTDLMLNEITKESVSYGYAKSEEKFSKVLASGQTIEGKKATMTYKGEKEIYTVATYGRKDEGIIVITMLMNEDSMDKEMIDLFLNTLRIRE